MKELDEVPRKDQGFFYDLGTDHERIYDKIHSVKRLTIGYNSYPDSPRDWGNRWNLSCVHKKYDLGDKDCRLDCRDYNNWEEYGEALREKYDIVEIVPLSLTDHSGLSLNVGTPVERWDSGQIGFAFLTAEGQKDLAKLYDGRALREASLRALEQELKVYEEYLNGEGYFIKIEEVNTGETISQVGSFYGSDFVASGLYDEIPMEFANDVIKSIPEHFPSLKQKIATSLNQNQNQSQEIKNIDDLRHAETKMEKKASRNFMKI